VASLGSKGDPTTGPTRVEESRKALSVLNLRTLIFREKAGIDVSDFDEIREEIYRLVQAFNPSLILCLGPHDSHQEHRYLYELMISGARRSKSSIMLYGILSNTLSYQPKIFVDISEHYTCKKEALRCFVSQKDKYYMKEDFLNIFHTHKYPNLHGIKYCESFQVERLFI
jgi:LmbE family N-acetylglucosaminyl deacetylase